MSHSAHEHFNHTAAEYDYWKQKNWYYYAALKKLYGEFIPRANSVLEIGCGTGDILASLEPSTGLGIDISEEMIQRAAKKHPSLQFRVIDLFAHQEAFDHQNVMLADVLEHLDDPPAFMKKLRTLLAPGTTVVVSVANPLWEPILMIAEKLKMKMPEGPHHRMSIKENDHMFDEAGFAIKQKGYRLLIPKPLPGGNWLNTHFSKTPLRYFGFIVYWVLQSR